MNTAEVAKKHQELRDKAIAKSIKEAIDLLDNIALKESLLLRVLEKYEPKIEQVEKKLEEKLNRKLEEITVLKIEELINDNLKRIFDSKLEEKIAEMIDDELDRRLSQLVKNYDREDY